MSTPTDMDASLSTAGTFPHWRWNLRILWLTQAIAMAGMSAFLPFLPLYVRHLGHLSVAQAQWWGGLVIAAPFLTALVATPFWGIIADRYGRKLVLVRAAFGLGVTVFLMGLAPTVEALFVLRLLQGALSGFVAATTGFVAAETPPQRVGYALGLLQSAAATGSVVGPLFGGVFSDAFGMRWTFIVVGVLCVGVGAIVWGFVREQHRPGQRVLSPLEPFRYVAHSSAVLTVLGAIVLAQAAMMMPAPIFPLYLEQLAAPQGLLSTVTGLSVGIAGLTMALAAPFWARFAEARGYGRTLFLCTVMAALLYLAQAVAPHYSAVILFRSLLGAAVAGVLPTFYAVLSSYAPTVFRSSIMGVGSSATLLGNLLGPLLGSTLAACLGMRWVFAAASVLMTVLSVLNPQARLLTRQLLLRVSSQRH